MDTLQRWNNLQGLAGRVATPFKRQEAAAYHLPAEVPNGFRQVGQYSH
jgi:hypothetical protein